MNEQLMNEMICGSASNSERKTESLIVSQRKLGQTFTASTGQTSAQLPQSSQQSGS